MHYPKEKLLVSVSRNNFCNQYTYKISRILFLIGDIEEELELAKGVSGMKIETLVSDLHYYTFFKISGFVL